MMMMMMMMNKAKARVLSVIAALDKRWFAHDVDAAHLALVRIVLGALLAVRSYESVGWVLSAATKPVALHTVSPIVEWAPLMPHPAPPEFGTPLFVVYLASAVLMTLGVLTRVSTALCAALTMWIFAVASSGGIFNHGSPVPALALVVLIFAPGTSAYSVDRALLRHRARTRAEKPPPPWAPPAPGWGKEIIIALLALIYLASGIAKLRHGGIAWLDGSTLSFYLSGFTNGQQLFIAAAGAAPEHAASAQTFRDGVGLVAHTYASAPTALGLWMSTQRWLCVALCGGTLVVELGAPLALMWGGRARTVGLALGLSLHVGIASTLGIMFSWWMALEGLLLAVALAAPIMMMKKMRAASPFASTSGADAASR